MTSRAPQCHRWHLTAVLGLAVLGRAPRLSAQTPVPSPPHGAADSAVVTAGMVARYLAELTADSLQRTDSAGTALEHTAQYVAAQFAKLSLEPGNRFLRSKSDTTWLQHYPLPGQQRLDYATATLRLQADVQRAGRPVFGEAGQPLTRTLTLSFTRAARYVSDVAAENRGGQVVLVAGPQSVAALRQATGNMVMNERIVLYLPLARGDTLAEAAVQQYLAATSAGVVLLSRADSATFATQVVEAQRRPRTLADAYLRGDDPAGHAWVVEVWPPSMLPMLRLAGVDPEAAQTAQTAMIRELPLQITVEGRVDQDTSGVPILQPNVLGSLKGRDSTLRREYLAVVAHLGPTRLPLDATPHDGRSPSGGRPSPSAVSMASLLTLAEMFSRPENRLKRPLLFVVTSGGEKDFWGSRYFGAYASFMGKPGLAIALDLHGPVGDSVLVAGLSDLDLPIRPAWIAAEHPEWQVQVGDGGTVFGQLSDVAVLARHGIPSLLFRTSAVDSARVGAVAGAGPAASGNPKQVAHAVQLVGEVLRRVANGTQVPQWNEEGRARYLDRMP